MDNILTLYRFSDIYKNVELDLFKQEFISRPWFSKVQLILVDKGECINYAVEEIAGRYYITTNTFHSF